MSRLRELFALLRDTFREWSEDKASTWAAAIAYYTIFSIGPLLLIAVSIAGLAFGQGAAQGQIAGRLEGALGREAAQVVQGLLQAANRPREGIIGTAVGFGTLLLGASGLFGQLQSALNSMWEVEPPKRGIFGTVAARGLGLIMVLGSGLLLLALLVASAAISAVATFFSDVLPGPLAGMLLQAVDFVVSFAVITLVFAAIYRFLPDTTVAWRNVWLGAAFTALLFVIGKVALGIYLGSAGVGSAFGAAGSLVLLLVWIYYSAQIFLFGAEFTQVYSNKYGPRRVPAEHAAQPEAGRDIAEQGGPPEEKGRARPERERAAAQEVPAGGGRRGDRGEEGRGAVRPGGPAHRQSFVRGVIARGSLALGVVAAAAGILRGRG